MFFARSKTIVGDCGKENEESRWIGAEIDITWYQSRVNKKRGPKEESRKLKI